MIGPRLIFAGAAALILIVATAHGQKPANMPDSDFEAIFEQAKRVAVQPDTSVVDFPWNSGVTGHSGSVAPVASREGGRRAGDFCRSFAASYDYTWQSQAESALFLGTVCQESGRWQMRSLVRQSGKALPDFASLSIETYRNSAGHACTRNTARGTDTCKDPCGREYPARSGPPALPAPQTQPYQNPLGHSCTLITRTVEDRCQRRQEEQRTCTAPDGSTYTDDGSLEAPRESAPFQNAYGDTCVRRTGTRIENGAPRRVTTENCIDRNGAPYANGDVPSADPSLMTSIQRMLQRLSYLGETEVTGRYGPATLAAIRAFSADDGSVDSRRDEDVARRLALAVDRTDNLDRAACELADNPAGASVCLSFQRDR